MRRDLVQHIHVGSVYMVIIVSYTTAGRADVHSTYIYIFTNVGREKVRSNVNSPLHNGNNSCLWHSLCYLAGNTLVTTTSSVLFPK